jgi:hypothetical protein
MRALNSPDLETKQAAARWLSGELRRLRADERKTGTAPVLKGNALSRLAIADLAMTMVENFADDIGDELVCLLQELLDIDWHRRALAERPSKEFEFAVQIVAQSELQGMKTIGVRELAKIVSVSPSTISGWQKCDEFQEAVAEKKRFWEFHRDLDKIRADNPGIETSRAFKLAIELRQRPLGREEK